MTQRNPEIVDAVFARLVNAPAGLDCQVTEVLVAIGRFTGAILLQGYDDLTDRQTVLNWFTKGLESYVHRNHKVIQH
jgi:hypothetical protein